MRIFIVVIFILLCFDSFCQEKRMLSLEECIDIAVENNLSVQTGQLSLQSSQVTLSQARAQRYPSINVSGNYGFNWGRGIDPTTNQFINQRINFNGLSGSVSVPLINGLQVTNGIKQSALDVEASKADLQKIINDVSLNTVLNYLNVILNKELLENAKFQMSSSQQQLDRTKILVAAGALPQANEFQLESQLATNEVDLVNAQNNLDLSLLALKQSLLLPPGNEIDIIIPEIEIDETSIESKSILEVYETALTNQPEIKSAELGVKSAAVGLEVSKGGLYPTLNLSGSVSTNFSDAQVEFIQSSATPELQATDLVTASGEEILLNTFDVAGDFETVGLGTQYDNNFSQQLALVLNIPILNGLSAKSAVQQSKIALQEAEINSMEQKNILYQTIESAYRNALASSKTYSASLKQVASLKETYRSVENQYNNGAVNFTEYQVAANNLFQAQSALSRAKFDFIFRKKILDFYLGNPLSF